MRIMIDQGIVPDTISCNCIFETLCEAGRTADANQLRVLAKEKGFEADSETYRVLVQGFGRQGRRKEGEAVLDEMLDSGFIPTLSLIIGFLMAYVRKDFEDTREFLRGCESTRLKVCLWLRERFRLGGDA